MHVEDKEDLIGGDVRVISVGPQEMEDLFK
jgi:hypothetical protein